MDTRDSQAMIKLAREGKQISEIWKEDFPKYDYWEVYWEITLAGEKSSVGTMRKITNRLNKLKVSKKDQEIVDEINSLIVHLYTRYRENQKKLDKIRTTIAGN